MWEGSVRALHEPPGPPPSHPPTLTSASRSVSLDKNMARCSGVSASKRTRKSAVSWLRNHLRFSSDMQ